MSDELLIDAKSPKTHLDLPELWRFRELFVVMIQRDIAVRYQETALGAAWALLQPLAMVVVFSVVFGRMAGMPSSGLPYPPFALAGLLPWLFCAATVQAASASVLNSRNLISKVYFPRLIIPIAALGAPLLDFGIASALMLGLIVYYAIPLTANLALLPALTLIAVLTAAGAGSLMAALAVAYRDFRHALPLLITLWLFLTPVIYPTELIPEAWRWLLWLNPMAGVADGMRSAWLGLPFDWSLIAAAALGSIVLCWGGTRYFRAVERKFADWL